MSQQNTKRVRFAVGNDPAEYLAPGSSSDSGSSRSSRHQPSTPHPSSYQTLAAPRMEPIRLPSASPNTARSGLPPPGHYGHYTQPQTSALYADHSNPIRMSISQTIGIPSPLIWDVSFPSANAIMQGVNIPLEALQQAATNPPVQSFMLCITLQSAHPLTITINPLIRGGYVTNADVLGSIYNYLRQPISDQMMLNMDSNTRQGVESAYHARYRALSARPADREREKSKGLKCVDLLLKRTRWVGINLTQPAVGELFLR